MFSRVSRYRDLPDVVATDARGRAVRSRSLRLLPAVQGVLAHTLEEGERLDHLADRYYGQPRSWWRIADANPELLPPDDLLGDGPRRTVVVSLEWKGPRSPWSELLRALHDTPGVEDAAMGTAAAGEGAVEVAQGPVAFAMDPALAADLDASVRVQRLTEVLLEALSAGGVELSDRVRLEKPGPATWHLVDLATGVARTAQLRAGPALDLHVAVLRHRWAVEVAFNRFILSATGIAGVAEGLGFAAGPPRELRRMGAVIAVPPRPA